jgi:hypothetical protein
VILLVGGRKIAWSLFGPVYKHGFLLGGRIFAAIWRRINKFIHGGKAVGFPE